MPDSESTQAAGLLHKTVILSALLLSLFLAALDFSIITTTVSSIARQLAGDAAAYTWIGSAYLLTGAAVAPVWGRGADVWGRRPALLSAIALFAVGSAICGWSASMGQLIGGRAVQGSAAGGIIVLVNIAISDLWTTRYRGVFLATTGLVWALSAGIGPLLGGVFAQYSTWRWAFWINLPCSLVAFVALYLMSFAPRHPADEATGRPPFTSSMDWIGSVAMVGASVIVLLSLDFGGVVSPWTSPKVLAVLAGGFVLLVAFVLWEARGSSSPLIPAGIVNSLAKLSPLTICFAHGFVNMASWYFLPLYFQAVVGATPTRSGILLMPIVVVQAVVGIGAGFIISHSAGVKQLIWTGLAVMTLGLGLFASTCAATPLAATVAFEIVTALGVGLVFQAPLIAYQSVVNSVDMAVATALFGFVRSLSTAVSVVIGGVVFQNGMAAQAGLLEGALGVDTARDFTASLAATNVLLVRELTDAQQDVVKRAYLHSLRNMWAMYAGMGGLGIVASLFLRYDSVQERQASFHEEVVAATELDVVAQRDS